jgi:ABC-type sugar transport system ATPase subunit
MTALVGSLPPALQTVRLGKTYPGVVALRDVSFVTMPGEVHALVGENGAGKSTLVKIIAGAIAPDSGSVAVYGQTLVTFSPRQARSAGIAVIHQERQIAADLSVTENILLGRPPTRRGIVRWGNARRIAATILAGLDAEIDLDARVRDLRAAERQLLEIARALHIQARVVLMDEPTSSLGPHETAQLFRTIRRLKEAMVAVVYVSHHLEEVLDLADRISVLRDGQLVATVKPNELDTRRLAELMIGRPLPARAAGRNVSETAKRSLVLEMTDVVKMPALGPVSLHVAAGEVVCVTGVVGSGRRELARLAAFIETPEAGSVRALGTVPRSVRDAVRRGIVFLSDDRKGAALLTAQTTHDNIAIGPLVGGRDRVVRRRALRRIVSRAADQVGVTAGRLDDPIEHLSGGNQQKALLGRWMAVNAKLYVLDEPTVGVDVGARAEIYELLRDQVRRGAAVLCFSSDNEEIREIADRVIVLKGGQIAGELVAGEITADALVALQHAVA